MQTSVDLVTPAPPRPVAAPTSARDSEGIFTHYLRTLDAGGEASAEALETLWQALRTAVVAELRRRSAWTSPPSYFGIDGWASWQAWEPGPGRTRSALDELVTDCYCFVFLEQRPRLRAQLAVKPNVDGLVLLYLRNYLHDRRKHHDLLGFRVFESLRSAVEQALESGELWALEGGPKVLNATVLSTSPETAGDELASAETLKPLVEKWSQELMPDLVTAGGARRRDVVARIRRRLRRLESEGVAGFRFKDLVDLVKRDVRARWAAVFDFEEGETAIDDAAPAFADVVRLVQPDDGVEARDSFEKLVVCVSNLVEGLAEEKARHYLRDLWGFLRAWASGEGPESLPSGRRLGELLYIPRKRLPRLWTTLRELVEQCRTALAGSLRQDSRSEGAS